MTYAHVYENLGWAHRTATASPVPPPDLKSEYLRCISGAYHTIGATLCQAERFGGAARFLQQACELGASAVSGTRLQDDGRDKQRTNLLQNLYRRWEMLGVCYLRIGDRKVRNSNFCHDISLNCFRTHIKLSWKASKFFPLTRKISPPPLRAHCHSRSSMMRGTSHSVASSTA